MMDTDGRLPTAPGHSDKPEPATQSPPSRASVPSAGEFLAHLFLDVIPTFEVIIDFEALDYDECAALEGQDLCGSTWCHEVGCITYKLKIARRLAQGMEARQGGDANAAPSRSDDSPVGNADAP